MNACAAIVAEADATGPSFDQARAAYLAAKAAQDAYVDDPYAEAMARAELQGPTAMFDDRLTDEADRLTDLRCDAEEAMIAAPAPDITVVLFKIELARRRWEDMVDWPENWWDAVLADLRRLGGVA